MTSTDRRLLQNQACTAGQHFAKLFYETLERKRHMMSNFYLDSAHVVWNGNSYSGKESIAKFYESIPEITSDVRTVDAQPIIVPDDIAAAQTSIMVSVSGQMRCVKKSQLFSETFILTAQPGAQGNVWKIVSDCLRFHEP